MKTVYTLLIFTQFIFHTIPSILPFREHDQSIRRTKDADDDSLVLIEAYYGCLGDCNITLPKPKKIINPYKEQLNSKVPPKPFGTFCIRCAACLAVANEVQVVIENVNQECETDPEKRNQLTYEIEQQIKNLCENGFRNFDLRLYKEHEIITNNFQCTSHVATAMDGNWTKKLRDICGLYISRIHLETITTNVLDSIGNLTDVFCRDIDYNN
ncbi:uncharacterized protein LOC126741097 isoform X2 [Anthonomus grandis grandis]|uniref:uncharacterized protein LOC126741097 isoform X2 n=1 Tax=Anthonomus grandis grandis TaxID=2921223 RepID=UPI002165C1ED|nr:uncharacterized protein LOC126741097 isoform X2 [Anthonomus grandis grandis]